MTALAPGVSLGGWSIVRLDAPLAKRALVRCDKCQQTQHVSVEAFMDATLRRCGCSSRQSARPGGPPAPGFDREIATLEKFSSGRYRRRS